MARLAGQLDLVIRLERSSRVPLARQLASELRASIRGGRLLPGALLPPTRALAAGLGVARHVAIAAYEELAAEGWTEARSRAGTRVRGDLPEEGRRDARRSHSNPRWAARAAAIAPERLPPGTVDVRLGGASLGELRESIWRRAWRWATRTLPPGDRGPVAGDPELREAISAYLGRTRGVLCDPEEVIVTSGAAGALDLIVRAAVGAGEVVAVEEPGYPWMNQLVRSRGARPLLVPTDEDGALVDRLFDARPSPTAVHLTPAHQYPLGGRLSVPRRMALLDWAARSGVLVIENDYEGEFRHGAAPLPTLHHLDGAGCVVFAGTFSKALTPSLRIGFLVAPVALRAGVRALLTMSGPPVPWPAQRALLFLLRTGELERHLRRLRREYSRKRDALRAALASLAPQIRVRGLDTGLHVFLQLPNSPGARNLSDRLTDERILVSRLEAFAERPPPPGVLMSYVGLGESDLRRVVEVLAVAIRPDRR